MDPENGERSKEMPRVRNEVVAVPPQKVRPLVRRTKAGQFVRRHGEAAWQPKEYRAWKAIKGRCLNPRSKDYPRYGGRGIKVCQRWLRSYPMFLRDVGRAPTPRHTIERIDNDKGYCPSNVRWALPIEQSNNRRDCVFLTYLGIRLTVSQWARRLGAPVHVLSKRHRAGWPDDAVLTTLPAIWPEKQCRRCGYRWRPRVENPRVCTRCSAKNP